MNDIETQAVAFAKATTSTRCAHMGECSDCAVRYCDYRSRRDAFAAGAFRNATHKQTLKSNPK